MRDAGAELDKLAHQLGVGPSRLEFLRPVPPDELRTLRIQIGEALFRADKHHFTKIVAVAKVVPAALAAKVTQFALPPLVAARTTELLDAARAVELVNRLPDHYLADVSAAMDPSRSPEVLVQVPPERVAAVARELARRGEWVVMGSFVSVVSSAALRAAVAELTGEQLLRISFVLDDLSRLPEITAALNDRQLDDLLAAVGRAELWREFDELLASLDESGPGRLAARFAVAPGYVRMAITTATEAGALTPANVAKIVGI